MATVRFLVVAEVVLRDSETGNVSAVNIIDDIVAESFPIFLQRSAILAYLDKGSGDSDEFEATLRISNNSQVLAEHLLKGKFDGKPYTRVIIKSMGTMFPEAGMATFDFLVGGHVLGSHPIRLMVRAPSVQVTPDK